VSEITTELPPRDYEVPWTMAEVLSGGPSPLGWHSVSTYMACPEASRLYTLGLRRKGYGWVPGETQLTPLSLGLLIHTGLAIRALWGQGACLEWLEAIGQELQEPDYLQASFMFRVYDDTYPFGEDPLRVLGVEIPVHTRLEPGLIRTVRYDAVVLDSKNSVYSLEHKTDKSGGMGAAEAYSPQASTQVALWNANEALIEKYGPMRGVIFDFLIKTKVPRCERIARETPKVHQRLALEYLRQSAKIKFPLNPDGSYPRLIHSCWGKYRPCEYVPLCWEGMHNAYEVANPEAQAPQAIT